MAFSTLTFTKSWENAADFPTYEVNEQQVRADLQYLHDEMRDAFNALVARLNDAAVAGELPIAPVEGLSAATVTHHMQILLNAGLVGLELRGARSIYSLNRGGVELLESDLREFFGQ